MSLPPARLRLLSQLANEIAARLTDDVLVVGIDGRDAAGKTVLADELAAFLEAQHRAVVRVSVDGFHHPARVRHSRDESSPGLSYYEDSFDYESFRRLVIEPLARGGSRRITPQIFDHLSDSPVVVSEVDVAEGSIVVIDGIFLGRPELRAAWDLWVYLYADPDVARARGVERDAATLGAQAEARYLRRWAPGQQFYHDAADPMTNADIVIDNTVPAAAHAVRWSRVP